MSTNNTLIRLEGTLNTRDIGGYRASTDIHTTVRRGVAFRSDNLYELSDRDLAAMDALGISSVFDFRSDREVDNQPSRLWPRVDNHVHVPITSGEADGKGFIELVTSGELVEVTEADVAETYIRILEQCGPQFEPVFAAIAARTSPVLFHCTAGKDRTGLATALLHGVCGVSRQDIIDDFTLSNRYRLPTRLDVLRPRFAAMGVDIEPLIPALAAPDSAMTAALDHLEERYGDFDKYLTGPVGMSSETVGLLRTALLS